MVCIIIVNSQCQVAAATYIIIFIISVISTVAWSGEQEKRINPKEISSSNNNNYYNIIYRLSWRGVRNVANKICWPRP